MTALTADDARAGENNMSFLTNKNPDLMATHQSEVAKMKYLRPSFWRDERVKRSISSVKTEIE